MKIREGLKRLWNDEAGQSTTEYILILSVVVMIAMKFRTAFSSKVGNMLNSLGGQLDGAVSDTGQ